MSALVAVLGQKFTRAETWTFQKFKTDLYVCERASERACVRSFVCSFVYLLPYSSVWPLIRPSFFSFWWNSVYLCLSAILFVVHSFVQSRIRSFRHSFIRPFIRSLVCSAIHCTFNRPLRLLFICLVLKPVHLHYKLFTEVVSDGRRGWVTVTRTWKHLFARRCFPGGSSRHTSVDKLFSPMDTVRLEKGKMNRIVASEATHGKP